MTIRRFPSPIKSRIEGLVLALFVASAGASTTHAQSVIFPQAQQAGSARLQLDADTLRLSNDLLTARFVKKNGSLVFGGCAEMNIEAGSEIFELLLGDGSTLVKASDLQLISLEEKTLSAQADAVKGAHRFAGKAIEAKFKRGDLSITWRAVLRDGSHYLRTELELTAAQNVKMYALRPMNYKVNIAQAKSVPTVVGNTRGAVVLSENIFAGLETPTGINRVISGNNLDALSHKAWNNESFSWSPARELPQGIRALGYEEGHVSAMRGYLTFKEAGAQTITFNYQSGNHRLNLVGVDVLNLAGEVVTSDYHNGFTGAARSNNSYTINIPKRGVYLVRYFVETRTESIHSSGVVIYSKSVAAPVVLRNLPPNAAPIWSNEATANASPAPNLPPISGEGIAEGEEKQSTWSPNSWMQIASVPARINELGHYAPHVYSMTQNLAIKTKGQLTAEFVYQSGNNRLDLCGVDLVDADNNVVVYDYHNGFSGTAKQNHVYRFQVPYAGNFRVRYWVQNKNEALTSSGRITLRLENPDTLRLPAAENVVVQGTWSRNTTLLAGDTWKVGSVIGIVAPEQARRSFLAYSERERAVPWRAMPAYISWYELNIDRNNDPNYTGNMNINQCVDVVKQWKKNLFDKYGTTINSFVWDDGWDQYGSWTFNKNFPNGLAETDAIAKEMGAGQGAWLGPVGGYGTSGNYRRNYWANKGGMQLSNPAYYKVFTEAITDLCKNRNYDFRFFKFDGISAQFSSVGPDAGTVGEENAEAIIRAERMVRDNIKEDIFFNTSVGTWASPFWFNVTDAVWRQENDYGEIGNQGTDREKWITYRDRLVYQNFVQNSPICPINTLMTHGFILSKYGNVSKSMDYEGIVRELRCAFACGSGMVELYNDYALTNSIYGGKLWGDIAECIQWQKDNADVLPDVHWVGGNPWDGAKANVYGWASWNGKKATLALRNPATTAATYKTTLRAALEVPTYVTGSIVLRKAFTNQAALAGLTEGQAVNLDTELTLTLPGSSVFVFNGLDSNAPVVLTDSIQLDATAVQMRPSQRYVVATKVYPETATDKTLTWVSDNPEVATVKDGVITSRKLGTARITVTTANGQSQTIVVTVATKITAISSVYEDQTITKAYDATGRPTSATQKGFVIVDGKKLMN